MTLSPSFFYIFVLSRNTQRESQWVPENLLLLLNLLAKSKIKQEALVQCIIKAVSPRTVILPILYRIEIELNNLFGSKWLFNELYRLGYFISYDEVPRCKQVVLLSENSEQIHLSKIKDKASFTQFVADNADHTQLGHISQISNNK